MRDSVARALILKWRAEAERTTAAGFDEGYGSGLTEAADELEAAVKPSTTTSTSQNEGN